MFQHVDAYPGDPILTPGRKLHKDPREQKVNLGIGLYMTNKAVPPARLGAQGRNRTRQLAAAPVPVDGRRRQLP